MALESGEETAALEILKSFPTWNGDITNHTIEAIRATNTLKHIGKHVLSREALAQSITNEIGQIADAKLHALSDSIQELVLGRDPTPDFQIVLDAMREKAEFENTDRTNAKKWHGPHATRNWSHIPEMVQFGGSAMSNTLFETRETPFFPDIEQPTSIIHPLIPSLAACDRFGFASFAERESYLTTHTRSEKIDATDPKNTPELAWLFRNYPDAKRIIEQLQTSGVTLELRRLTNTPDMVLTAIQMISILTQHQWTVNWLPDLIRDGKIPDLQKNNNKKNHTDAPQIKAQGFDRAKQFFETEEHLQQFADVIHHWSREYIRIIGTSTDGQPLSNDQINQLTHLNRIIEPLQKEYAVRHIQFDYSYERTELTRNILKGLLVFGTATEILEDYFKLPAVAKLVAGAGDDILGEIAEIQALIKQGFTMNEIVKKRWPLYAVGGIGVVVLASLVDPILKSGRKTLAGVDFGVSAVLLSFITATQSVVMFKENLDKLIVEGKVAPISQTERWKKAISQDFNNPVRGGIYAGVAFSPVFSAFMATYANIFSYPLILPLVGQAETYGGVFGSWTANEWMRLRWNNFCAKNSV